MLILRYYLLKNNKVMDGGVKCRAKVMDVVFGGV